MGEKIINARGTQVTEAAGTEIKKKDMGKSFTMV